MKTVCFALLFVLTACDQTTVSPLTQTIASKTIPPPLKVAASPTLTLAPIPSPTDTPVPRWVEYQSALASAFYPKETGVLCEWDLLGQQGREVYLWAICFREGSAGSAPAVVQLGTDDKVEKVTLPRDGAYYSQDVRMLFPPDVQQKVFALNFSQIDDAHVRARLKDPSLPPLIVVSGTPLP